MKRIGLLLIPLLLGALALEDLSFVNRDRFLTLYGVNAIPHLILFGPDGTILRRGLRGEEIYAALEELL